jgi:hypothetical protein
MMPCITCPLSLLCLEASYDVYIPFCVRCGQVVLSGCRAGHVHTHLRWFTNTPCEHPRLYGRIELGVPMACPRRGSPQLHTACVRGYKDKKKRSSR